MFARAPHPVFTSSDRRRALVALAVVVVVQGCEPGDPLADGFQETTITCSSCHGSGDDGAPPRALDGTTATTSLGVGAHRIHLFDGPIRAAVSCDECHVVPVAVDDEGHVDALPAEVTFGPLARAGAASPTWDRRRATCSNVACHGDGTNGGDRPEPVWTVVDGSGRACTTCHGSPPPLPHPPRADCGACHSATVDAFGRIDVVGGAHVDGIVNVDALTCASCHGTGANPAPPVDLFGRTDTSLTGVGAHRQHLDPSVRHAPIACDACHVVPASVGADGHIDDGVRAEVVFGPEAYDESGLPPSWDGVGCSNVGCHGSDLSGGSAPAPIWTLVDGSQRTCGSCHGNPPPAPHPPLTNCASCHFPEGSPQSEFHVDGVVQARSTGCTSCHGGVSGNSAPPWDLSQNSDPSAIGVGAHQVHLQPSSRHPAFACVTCHAVPAGWSAPGHIDDDDGTAEVTFSGLAVHEGFDASYERPSCSNVYCHGDGSTGGTKPEPVWNVVTGIVDCTGCHGFPPTGGHPARTDCFVCHGDVVSANPTVFVNSALHVDGIVQGPGAGCVGCHGSGDTPAPPRDTSGGVDESLVSVGAHRAHVEPSPRHGGVACASCHVVPENNDDPGHYDTALPAELTFSGTAIAKGASPSWDGVGCSNVYCHGNGLPNGPGNHPAPIWTLVNGSQRTCLSCHGLPPAGTHPPATECASCHGEVIDDAANFIRPELHVNGFIDTSCKACHGNDDNPAPPRDLAGNVATTFTGVGAHQAHLASSTTRATIACSACHVAPTEVTDPGHLDDGTPTVELVWGAVASADGVIPDFDGFTCNVYCHGVSLSPGGTNTAPQWTDVGTGAAQCGSCHSIPPPPPHPVVPSTICTTCHPFNGNVPLFPERHIDGVLDVP